MDGTAAAAPRRRTGGWQLPARPPEQWVAAAWSVLLTLFLGAAAVVPLTALLRADPRTGETVAAAALGGAVAAGCAGAAWSLLVQGRVVEDGRLPWLGTGFLLLHPAVLAATVARTTDGGDRPSSLLLLAVVGVLAATSPLAPRLSRRVVLLVLLLPVLSVAAAGAAAAGGWRQGTDGVALALVAAGLAVWWRATPSAGPWRWPTVGLGLSCAALGVGIALDPAPAWEDGTTAVALLVPSLGLVVRTLTGYSTQARRWRELEQEVRDSRIPTALLPGRSVTPEDDEGLPDPEEVDAVLRDEAVLVALQPVLRLSDREVVGVEALARFGGRIPTDRWFRGASRYGRGLDLEVLCLGKALALLPDLPASQFLAVNVSPAAIVDARALAAFEQADLSRVVVEVTEHEAVADYPGVRAVLQRLRSRGARIAVDDTGAGYASLRHVLLLQPEVVKLDTVLVRDLGADPRKRALVVALTTFAQEVGSTVLAEGIETPEQVEALLGIGVDLGQGWHLGVPVLPGEQLRTGR